METRTREMYSEVYGILNMLGNSYIERIPEKLYNMIEREKEPTYNPIYDSNKPLENQNVDKQTIATIATFYLNFWCNTEEEKKEIRKILIDNEDKYQEELREKYNPDNIFKKKESKEQEEVEKVQMIEYKEGLIQKIINKIKKFFKRK